MCRAWSAWWWRLVSHWSGTSSSLIIPWDSASRQTSTSPLSDIYWKVRFDCHQTVHVRFLSHPVRARCTLYIGCQLFSAFSSLLIVTGVTWVNCLVASVCLSVCLYYNSKTNDSVVLKSGLGNDLGYPTSDTILGSKGQKFKVMWSQSAKKAIEYVLCWVSSL